MKLTFLGTSAGESYPALWCHCPNCEYARQHGGRNIRRNSCALVDSDLLLDLSNHIFDSALRFQQDITRVTTLLVTHNHRDHFDSQHLVWRNQAWRQDGTARGKMVEASWEKDGPENYMSMMGPRFTPVPFLDIYGHESVMDVIRQNERIDTAHLERYAMAFHTLERGQRFSLRDGTAVTALVSHHGTPGSVFNYLIERQGKTLLYALDCGGYDEDMLEILRSKRFHCVVLEGTFGKMPLEFFMHQNQNKNLRFYRWLEENGLWANEPNFYLSHMCPHWTPPYDQYSEEMEKYGIHVAYDGLTIEF